MGILLRFPKVIYSEACFNQAFSFGENIVGLQFHLEATSDCIHSMLEEWSDELREEPYIQNDSLIRECISQCEHSQSLLWSILGQIK